MNKSIEIDQKGVGCAVWGVRCGALGERRKVKGKR